MLAFIGSAILVTLKVWLGATIIWAAAILVAIPVYYTLTSKKLSSSGM